MATPDQSVARETAAPTAARSRKRAAGPDDESDLPRRKRSANACRMCKTRKVKCSNDRPACAGCVRLRCECVYGDDSQQSIANLELVVPKILSTLTEILQRLPPQEADNSNLAALRPELRAVDHLGDVAFLPSSNNAPSSATVYRHGVYPPEHGSPGATTVDAVLKWPVFELDDTETRSLRSLLLAADQEAGSNSLLRKRLALPQPTSDEDIVVLVRRFLSHVLIKNPIIDSKTILRDAKLLAETGPSWDPRSCLVLLACALGSLVKPFDPVPLSPTMLSETRSQDDEGFLSRAESYYDAARRRLGFLDRSIVASQCHLLTGIYLMYTMRPLQAWQSFFQASTTYAIYLESKGVEHPDAEMDASAKAVTRRSLEQRLYWSCLKSEHEMILNLSMPRSCLWTIEYPCMFPSPPPKEETGAFYADEFSIPAESPAAMETMQYTSPGSDITNSELLHEQSWFYYLTEISLFRLSNRIVQCFYSQDCSSWLRTNIVDMINAAQTFEAQLEEWKNTLPESIQFTTLDFSSSEYSELQLVTWGRHSKLNKLLYRPFLYRFVHPQASDTLQRHLIQPYAEKCVQACLDPTRAVGLRNRHHGTWYACQDSALSALILVASQRTGLLRIMNVEADVGYHIRLRLEHLKYWEDESPDIRSARQLIEKIRAEDAVPSQS